jgi:acetylornithine deacetylase/succinyl-diaminopimelate desuccinylase-like protein
MKMKVLAACLLALFASGGIAQVQPDPNPTIDGYLDAIAADQRVKDVVTQFRNEALDRFQEHMEIVRISSPSRQEYYRATEIYNRLKAFGFTDDELVYTGKNNSGIMPGSAVQQVDGLKVYQTCAISKGAWTGATDGANGIYSRPKVVIEGHIDTVFPAKIPDFDPDKNPVPYYYEPVKMQPIYDSAAGRPTVVVETPAELAAITKEMNFDANGKVIKDANWDAATITYNSGFSGDGSAWDDAHKAAYRLYVPGYADAIGNAIGVYHLAKLFKTNNLKPVHDVWFCFTAGEEGRGNLAGMKQLYGYNQGNAAENPADNGKNKLNIVANLSIDGGSGTFNYLGSYRYEVNYKGAQGAREAARRIAKMADVVAPSEDGTTNQRTTWTVGIAYPKEDGSTSFEIDMRSPIVPMLNEMKSRLYPKFGIGETTEDGVEIAELWYGDRPAHVHSNDLARVDPLLYAMWKARGGTGNLSTGSSSVNDNIPAAMNIPTTNLNIHATAASGGVHAFNEWGIRGNPDTEVTNLSRILYTLLAVSGLADASGAATIVPAAYPDKAPGHTNDVWDSETIWNK